MSEDKDSRTEAATPKREDDLRDEGKVARSADVLSAAVLLAGSAAIAFTIDGTAVAISGLARRALRLGDHAHPLSLLQATLPVLVHALLPVVCTCMVAAIIAGLAQTKGLFSLSLALPKAERLDITQNIQQVIPSKESLVETLKSLTKVAVLGVAVWRVVAAATPRFRALAGLAPETATAEVSHATTRVVITGILTFAVVAAFDYYMAWRRFTEEAKMSRQDVKDEMKQEDGDPLVKRRVRQRMREAAKRRAMSDMSKATVLVTNPTHVACALKYVPGEDPAPVLIAKALDEEALRMRAAARKAGVPIVENRPLARAIHRTGKVGKVIPSELFSAAAEVIAHVLRLRGGRHA